MCGLLFFLSIYYKYGKYWVIVFTSLWKGGEYANEKISRPQIEVTLPNGKIVVVNDLKYSRLLKAGLISASYPAKRIDI